MPPEPAKTTLRVPAATAAWQRWSEPEDVDLGVEGRVLDRYPHVGLGGEVEDHLRPALGHQVGQARVADVEAVEGEPAVGHGPGRAEVGQRTGREVVDHVDLLPLGQEALDEAGADEPGAPGDEDPQRG